MKPVRRASRLLYYTVDLNIIPIITPTSAYARALLLERENKRTKKEKKERERGKHARERLYFSLALSDISAIFSARRGDLSLSLSILISLIATCMRARALSFSLSLRALFINL